MTKELAKTIFTDVIQTFGYINNPTKVDACYVLRNSNFLDTQGSFPTHQHINVAKYISKQYNINDLNTMNNGSNFMMNVCGAIKITCWNGGKGIKCIYLPKFELTSAQYDALELFIAFVGKNVTEDWPLWIATYDEGQQIEYTKSFKLTERVIADIENFYYSGKLELTEELQEEAALTEAKPSTLKISDIKGYNTNGEPVSGSLADFLEISKSISENPHLADIDPQNWLQKPAIKTIYFIKCPRCHGIYACSYNGLENKKDRIDLARELNFSITPEELAFCTFCAKQTKRNRETGELKSSHPIKNVVKNGVNLLDRLHPDIAINGILTKKGAEIIPALNEEKGVIGTGKRQVSPALIDMIKNSPGMDLSYLSSDSPIYLEFLCPKHGKYINQVMYASKGIYLGCCKCVEESAGAQTSESERQLYNQLKKALTEKFGEKAFKIEMQYPSPDSRYHPLDIYIEYNNKKFGIEYDGKVWHPEDVVMQRDLPKAISCINNNINILRVRERSKIIGEWPADQLNIPIIEISSCFSNLSETMQKEAVDKIIKVITNGLNESLLLEDTRNTLVTKSRSVGEYKNQEHGKNRFERKRYSQIAKTVKQYNQIDMNKFFKEDLLIVHIPVVGETDSYTVSIKMDGVVAEIAKNIKNNKNRLEYRTIIQALTKVFNTANIFVKCTCDDYKYRFAHWNIVNNVSVDDTASDPGPGRGIRNPNDDKGRGCKHVLLVLANGDWLIKVASVINNYIHYAEEKLQKPFLKVIFPKLYGIPADEMVEQDLIDDDKYLDSSVGLIDAINEYGRNRGKYKPGSNKNPVTGTGGKTKKKTLKRTSLAKLSLKINNV